MPSAPLIPVSGTWHRNQNHLAVMAIYFKACLTDSLFAYKVRIVNAGAWVGDNAVIRLDAVPVSSNLRGFNVVALNGNEKTIRIDRFDTYALANPAVQTW